MLALVVIGNQYWSFHRYFDLRALAIGIGDGFDQLLKPRPKHVENGARGSYFDDFWSRRCKMLKPDLLELILLTSAANARNW